MAADALGSLAVDHPFVAAEEPAAEEGWEVWEDAQEEGAEEEMEGGEERPWDAALIRSWPETHALNREDGSALLEIISLFFSSPELLLSLRFGDPKVEGR